MNFPDPNGPGPGTSEEPNVLELLGFGTPSGSAPQGSSATRQPPPASNLPPHARAAASSAAQPGSRREQRQLERRPQSASAARRIRAIEKSHKKATRKVPRGARVAVATTIASRPSRGASRARKVGSRILSVGAMTFAAALAVGMSVPANAFGENPFAGDNSELSQATDQKDQQGPVQSMAADATVTSTSAAREAYSVTGWAEMLRLQYGTRDYTYEMGDPNGPIRWPFPYPVPISSGFGSRTAPCYGCSSHHQGVDLVPGGGTPIYAIADGIVIVHQDDSYGFGNHIIIDHGDLLGDGSDIKTVYAHMQHGSTALNAGDQISVGDFIGLVGRTGAATGNHLHLEVHVNDVPVDPFAWLQTNT